MKKEAEMWNNYQKESHWHQERANEEAIKGKIWQLKCLTNTQLPFELRVRRDK